MPLYKKKPVPLVENPTGLSPDEAVFQVRFTKEIFRDYGEYLNRICFYRKRIWMCKVTGKSNLTFEEALMSEKRAIEKVQQFPSNLVAPVLREVQYSMLNLKDLVSMIAEKLQESMVEGSELYGRKNNRIYPCKIMKVLEEEADKTQYQVAWLDKEKKVTGNAVVDGNDLIKKKLPFSREVLKSFIRESTYRSVPWVLHDELAQKHGISTDPPEDVVPKMSILHGCVTNGKRKRRDGKKNDSPVKNKKTLKANQEHSAIDVDNIYDETKYPIDDLLVPTARYDPAIAQRPIPSSDFKIPNDCVGDLLMVWDFCSSFGRLLQLSPFSLEDFENALCHKESYVVLIVETHSAFLCSLMKDNGEYFLATQRKKRKPKITLLKWTEYLCDFLEMVGTDEFSGYLPTIRRGHYGLLDVSAKLGILRELVARVLATELYREKLDEYIEERQALAAANREEALAEGRKRREAKDHKLHSNGNHTTTTEGRRVGSEGSNSGELVTYDGNPPNEATARGELTLRSESSKTKKNGMEKKADDKAVVAMNHLTGKGIQEVATNDSKYIAGEKGLKQRKEYLAREMEKRIIRTNPLGKDRHYNRYWFFRRDFRIYVESSDSKQWGYYSTKEELDSLIGSLNRKGVRERALKKELEEYYERICLGIQKKLKDSAAAEEADVRRSTRIRAPPRQNPALAFLKYENKWKED
ncbi:hypothetical protein DCAR_0310825 [Daucus carota subsp. sativus]|uniref:DDT domain-containing protein n=1 Tax=Daucus carota subsp. sativus TaxID=79200 RepID=A0AAF1AT86_DAUCS|nr:hypothetical protein DCAR_0310825 [Daucus carota subsp. sativus]